MQMSFDVSEIVLYASSSVGSRKLKSKQKLNLTSKTAVVVLVLPKFGGLELECPKHSPSC